MDFRFLATPAPGVGAVNADALLVVVAGDAPSKALDKALADRLDDVLAHGDFEIKAGRSLYLHRPEGVGVPRLAFAAAADASPKAFRAALQTGLLVLKAQAAVKHLAVAVAGMAWTDAHAEAVVAAVNDVVYLYRHTKPSAVPPAKLAKVSVVAGKPAGAAVQAGLKRGAAVAAGVELARELANRPGNHCTPTMVGQQARQLGKQHGFKVEVLDAKAIDKLGMGSFAAVARGSDEPPRFVVMHYQGAAKTAAPVVLVGKGITFDSGGISLKPGAEMDEMKFDMGGAASVLGTMRAIGELKPRINVVALVPTCENMPSGRAVKPGDVVTSMSGQTIEILNTDAEGRLILCDALTYAARFKPAALIDVATLTGACVIALGNHHSGMYANDDALADELGAASRSALDPAWRMPLDDEYAEGLKSNFADVANIAGRPGGSVTAAKFLQRFVAEGTPWAHFDIAGTAWKGGQAKGATGRPVALLTHFLLGRAG